MTASPAPPPDSDRSPYVWARSLKGALSAAQGLALAQIDRLKALEIPDLAGDLGRAEGALRSSKPRDLTYAGDTLEDAAKQYGALASKGTLGKPKAGATDAATLPKPAALDKLAADLEDHAGYHDGGAEVLTALQQVRGAIPPDIQRQIVRLGIQEARRLIATSYRYSYEGPDRGAGRRAYTGPLPLGETFAPSRYPVRLELLNAQEQCLSGGVYVDPEIDSAEDVPTLLTAAEATRRYMALRKQITRAAKGRPEAGTDRRGVAAVATEIQAATARAIAAWERMEAELPDDHAVRLLRQSGLHLEIRKAEELAEELLQRARGSWGTRLAADGRTTGKSREEIAQQLDEAREDIRAQLRRGVPQVQIAKGLELSVPTLAAFIREERLDKETPAPPPPVPAAKPTAKQAPAKAPAKKSAAKGKRR